MKAINKKENRITCPFCQKHLFNIDLSNVRSGCRAVMKCPHCQRYVTMTLKTGGNCRIAQNKGKLI